MVNAMTLLFYHGDFAVLINSSIGIYCKIRNEKQRL